MSKAKLAGILSIVAGGIGIINAGIYLAIIWFLDYVFGGVGFSRTPMPAEVYTLMAVIYGATAVFELVFSGMAIAGGVFAMKRKQWAVALAGCIAAIFAFFPCGVAAIVLVAPTRAEFLKTQPPAAA